MPRGGPASARDKQTSDAAKISRARFRVPICVIIKCGPFGQSPARLESPAPRRLRAGAGLCGGGLGGAGACRAHQISGAGRVIDTGGARGADLRVGGAAAAAIESRAQLTSAPAIVRSPERSPVINGRRKCSIKRRWRRRRRAAHCFGAACELICNLGARVSDASLERASGHCVCARARESRAHNIARAARAI